MKISYNKKRTKNLGNYENVVIEISAEDEVDISENNEQCFLRLKLFVDSKIEQELLYLENNSSKITHDKIKKHIINLISKKESNREIIKQYMLSNYNVSKVIDLKDDQLIELNEFLRVL